MSCDVGEATKWLENEAEPDSPTLVASPTSQLILQPFRRFRNVTAHSTTLPLLHLRHRHFTYVTRRADPEVIIAERYKNTELQLMQIVINSLLYL